VPENRADRSGQNDAVWGALPDNVRSGILALVNAAVRPQ